MKDLSLHYANPHNLQYLVNKSPTLNHDWITLISISIPQKSRASYPPIKKSTEILGGKILRHDLNPKEVSVMWLLHFMHRRCKCAEGWQVQGQVLFRPPLDHFLRTMVHHESLRYTQRVRELISAHPQCPHAFFSGGRENHHWKRWFSPTKFDPRLWVNFITGGLSQTRREVWHHPPSKASPNVFFWGGGSFQGDQT